jgi:hypothetical protein
MSNLNEFFVWEDDLAGQRDILFPAGDVGEVCVKDVEKL